MSIDRRLLEKALAASARLDEAERGVEQARAEYHAAVRKLHLTGGSLREIAAAVELSHQRVQQIVDKAGGTWWGRIWRSRAARQGAVCTFCERPQAQVAKLITGPDVNICDGCVERAEAVLAGEPREGETMLRFASRCRERCSFCGKRGSEALPLAAGDEDLVCVECVETCRSIIDDEREPRDRRQPR